MSAKIYVGKTNLAILNGDDDVRDWTDEELRRGQRQDKNGHWVGRPPKVIPKSVHDELVRRQYDEAAVILRDSLVAAVQLFADIVRDPEADPAIRLKAADIILKRVMGNEPIRLNVEVKSKWEQAISHAIVSLPADVIEAYATDESDDDRAGLYDDD